MSETHSFLVRTLQLQPGGHRPIDHPYPLPSDVGTVVFVREKDKVISLPRTTFYILHHRYPCPDQNRTSYNDLAHNLKESHTCQLAFSYTFYNVSPTQIGVSRIFSPSPKDFSNKERYANSLDYKKCEMMYEKKRELRRINDYLTA